VTIANLLPCRQHVVEVIAAYDMTQYQHAHQHGQPARSRDRQSHACAPARILAVIPVADQQERKKTGQFPEKYQLNDVSREHHPRHGPHEGQKKREKARYRISGRHVVARVKHHQRTNAEDQHGEQPGEPVHADHQIQPQRRQPGNLLPEHRSIGHFREQHPYLNCAYQRNDTREC